MSSEDQRARPEARGTAYDFDEGYDEAYRDHEIQRLRLQAEQMWALERAAVQAAGLASGQRIIDVGCGPGYLTERLALEAGAEGQVIGVDLSDDLLSLARQRPTLDGAGAISFRQGSVYDLPTVLDGLQPDFAYARMVFQHLTWPERAVRAIHDTLKPGGAAYILAVDDTLVHFTGAPPGFEAWQVESRRRQRLRGGDRSVGRRLAGLMHQAGFEQINAQVVMLNSERVGLARLVDIALSCKRALYTAEELPEVDALLHALRQSEGFGIGGVYVVTARRATKSSDTQSDPPSPHR